MQNPYEVGQQLHEDFSIVSSVQHSPERLDAMDALLRRSGCLSDALLVYDGADPAHEVDNAQFLTLKPTEKQAEALNRVVIGLHAAEVIMASVIEPNFFTRRDSKRVRMLSKEADWYKQLTPNRRAMTTPYDTIGTALDAIRDRAATTEELASMSKSAEMLSSALTWWQFVHVHMYQSDKQSYADDAELQDIARSVEGPIAAAVLAVQDMVKTKAVDEVLVVDDATETLERANLGLKAQWRTSAILLHPLFRHFDEQGAQFVLYEMVESLQKVFIDDDLINTKVYPKNEVKGLLHESVWLLDAFMIIMNDFDEYQTAHVGTAARRFDRPIIGRPALLRGIDYGIIDVEDEDGITQQINLKSGAGNPKEYHPRVKVVREENFQDMQRGRLVAKLDQYKRIIESGFTLPEASTIIEKYALATVKTELLPYKKKPISANWPFLQR